MFSGKPFAALWILAILGRALSLRVYSENLTLQKYIIQPILFDRRVYIMILPFNDRPVIDKVIDDIVDAFGVLHTKNVFKHTTSKISANCTTHLDISTVMKNEIYNQIEASKKYNKTFAILPPQSKLSKLVKQPSIVSSSTDLLWSKDVANLIRFVHSENRKSILSSQHDELEGKNISLHFELVDLVGRKDNMIHWINTILGSNKDVRFKYTYKVVKAEFNDTGNKTFRYLPKNRKVPLLILYHTEQCEIPHNILVLDYLAFLDYHSVGYGVILLHDERFGGCRTHFPHSRVVLTNLFHPKLMKYKHYGHVLDFPIGFQSSSKSVDKQTIFKISTDRKYIWSFAGNVMKGIQINSMSDILSNRMKMINEIMKANFSNTLHADKSIYVHLTYLWNDPTSLSMEKYVSVLQDSIFCPIAIGNSYPSVSSSNGTYIYDGEEGVLPAYSSSMRFYEALNQGCIPIVEDTSPLIHHTLREFINFETHFPKHTRHRVPFPIVKLDWKNVNAVFMEYLNDDAKLLKLQQDTAKWWQATQETIKRKVQKHLLDNLWKPSPTYDGRYGFACRNHHTYSETYICTVADYDYDLE